MGLTAAKPLVEADVVEVSADVGTRKEVARGTLITEEPGLRVLINVNREICLNVGTVIAKLNVIRRFYELTNVERSLRQAYSVIANPPIDTLLIPFASLLS
jgi:hypothetical protein